MKRRATIVSFCALATFATLAGPPSPTARADVGAAGKYYACFNGVAVRKEPLGGALDNLTKGQTFVVTGHLNDEYVYGYKLVNGLHGFVRRYSIDKSCK